MLSLEGASSPLTPSAPPASNRVFPHTAFRCSSSFRVTLLSVSDELIESGKSCSYCRLPEHAVLTIAFLVPEQHETVSDIPIDLNQEFGGKGVFQPCIFGLSSFTIWFIVQYRRFLDFPNLLPHVLHRLPRWKAAKHIDFPVSLHH